MMQRIPSIFVILWIVAGFLGLEGRCFAAQTPSQDAKQASAPSNDKQNTKKPDNISKPSVTHHIIQINGQILRYTATAGYLPVKDRQGKLEAEMFFTAYAKEGEEDLSRRPVTFAFNGGPGASSIWLHIGGLGPKRIPLAEDGTALPQTYKLVDNESTWLDFTDLVFIDPIGTGYSHAAPGVNAKKFYDVDRDVQTAADFMQLYLTQYNRWLSPKFIAGESYGGTRAGRACAVSAIEVGY